jgi:hypothetical protein
MDISMNKRGLKANIQGMAFDLVPVSENTFKVSHWLLKLGLDEILSLPIDLRELQMEFIKGERTSHDVMIINIGGINYEVCPKYPEIEEVPTLWEKLTGEYELSLRLSSIDVGSEIIGRDEILIENGILLMPGFSGPLMPISDTEIIIQGGPFAGETMVLEPDTGYIYHQAFVYKPAHPE